MTGASRLETVALVSAIPLTRLHERAGFRMAGTLTAVGFKLGRWVDSVLMQRALGAGDRALPPDARAMAETRPDIG